MNASLPESPEHPISDDEFLKFREFFYRKTGIMFADNKRYFVDKRLGQEITNSGARSFRDYFNRLCFEASGSDLQSLVNSMTVNETYFYRESYQLDCLVRSILPEVVKPMARGSTVKIWSIPCSTGEEPYSIALYLLEKWRDVDDYNIEIVASDIDTDVLKKARTGTYSDRSFQHLPRDVLEKYTTPKGEGQYQVIKEIRGSIRFSTANIMDTLLSNQYRGFDVIFCRNLLIYFDDMSRREAVEALYAAMKPGAFLCLGHSESMSRISSLFSLRKFPEAIVYQKPLEP